MAAECGLFPRDLVVKLLPDLVVDALHASSTQNQ
jgi:hypothetical protein